MTITGASLAGRIAFVTGAGSGIGRAVCNLLARESATIIAVDINRDNAEQTIAGLKDGGKHRSFALNVSKKVQVDDVFAQVLASYKKPASILINCAGITRDAQIGEMTEELFDEVMAVNLKGTFLAIQVTNLVHR